MVRREMPPETHASLTERYREEIHRLEALIERDLASWLAPPARPPERGDR
jgi:hypothetical protein